VFCVVVLGKKVIGTSAWRTYKGKPADIPRECIIAHQAASGAKVKFRVSASFDEMHASLSRALRAVAGLSKNWLLLGEGQPVAAGEVKLERLSDLVYWLIAARRVAHARGQAGLTAQATPRL